MASFPRKESLLNLYFIRVVAYILANILRFLVSDKNKDEMTDCLEVWETAYPNAINPSTSTEDKVADKNMAREKMKSILRIIFGDIATSKLTYTDRTVMRIPLLGGYHAYVPMTDCWPIGSVDQGSRLSHKISYLDNISGKKGKPYGVKGCEVWSKIGGIEPVSQSEMVYLGTKTTTPFFINYDGTQGGLKVYYWIRWVDKKNKGNWGPCFFGIILP